MADSTFNTDKFYTARSLLMCLFTSKYNQLFFSMNSSEKKLNIVCARDISAQHCKLLQKQKINLKSCYIHK